MFHVGCTAKPEIKREKEICFNQNKESACADNHILERLGVEKVPSVIIQEGVRLKVEEKPVN